MNREQIIEFLTEKSRLCSGYMNTPAVFAAREQVHLKALASAADFSRQVRFMDQFLDQMIRGAGGKAAVAETRRALQEKFGVPGLSETPDNVARKVLKRGAIVSEEEGEIVRDLLADGPWCESFGEKRALKLEGIYSDYEKSLQS